MSNKFNLLSGTSMAAMVGVFKSISSKTKRLQEKESQVHNIRLILNISSRHTEFLLEKYSYDYLRTNCLQGWRPPEFLVFENNDI